VALGIGHVGIGTRLGRAFSRFALT